MDVYDPVASKTEVLKILNVDIKTNEKELLAVDSKNIIKINFKTFKQMLSISNKTKED